jgi:hypothetical protein
MPLYKKKTTKDNKRKKVVKGKTISGNAKFKSVTNKKTGVTRVKTKTKAGKSNPTSKSKTTVSAKAIMPMLRKIAPDSPTAKAAMKAIKMPVKATRAKKVKK